MEKRISNGIKRNKIYANRKWKIFAIRIEIIIPLLLPHLGYILLWNNGFVLYCVEYYIDLLSSLFSEQCPEKLKRRRRYFMTFTSRLFVCFQKHSTHNVLCYWLILLLFYFLSYFFILLYIDQSHHTYRGRSQITSVFFLKISGPSSVSPRPNFSHSQSCFRQYSRIL